MKSNCNTMHWVGHCSRLNGKKNECRKKYNG